MPSPSDRTGDNGVAAGGANAAGDAGLTSDRDAAATAALRERVASAAERGDWDGVHDLLAAEPRKDLVSDPALAYRFAEALYFTGRAEELAVYAAVYERAARAAADVHSILRSLNLGGIAAFELGKGRRARNKFDSLMELAEAEGNEEMLARAANNLGAISNLRGRRHEALAYYRLALPIYHRLGWARGLAQTHHNMGLTWRDLNRYEDAIDAFRKATALAETLAFRSLVSISTSSRAEVELRRGDSGLALQLAERGVRAARQAEDPLAEAEGLRVRALAKAARAAAAETASATAAAATHGPAIADLEAARRLARRSRNALLEAEVDRDLGLLLIQSGDGPQGVRLLEEAAARFEALGAEAELTAVREALAGLS